METRKYFDYELAYQMYKDIKMIFEVGLFGKKGFEYLKEFNHFFMEDGNGYIVVKDDMNTYNACVYLIDKNFDTEKEEDYYVSGEVDIISYGECWDNLYINDKSFIQDRLDNLEYWASEHNYTQEDLEKEKESLEKVLSYLQ